MNREQTYYPNFSSKPLSQPAALPAGFSSLSEADLIILMHILVTGSGIVESIYHLSRDLPLKQRTQD